MVKRFFLGIAVVLFSSISLADTDGSGGTGGTGSGGGSDDNTGKVIGVMAVIGGGAYLANQYVRQSQVTNRAVVIAHAKKKVKGYIRPKPKPLARKHTHRANHLTKSKTHIHKYTNIHHTHKYAR